MNIEFSEARTEFDVQFAGPINKEGIENIAKIDGKTPWIEPKKDNYYLTRMYKYMDIAEMSEDIYPEEKAFEHIAEQAKESFPHLKLLFEYAYGKPKESKQINAHIEQPLFPEPKKIEVEITRHMIQQTK